jgi:predicted GNAT family acetyltransferase
MEIYSTHVPNAQRGHRYGESLVYAALNFAKESGLKIKPTCSFAEHYFETHGQFSDILV